MVNPPFAVGSSYLFCQVTLYYVGTVVERGIGWVRLRDASWVHWTGRLSELLRTQSWKLKSNRKPRVEPCGDVILATAALVSAYPWSGPLPTEPIE